MGFYSPNSLVQDAQHHGVVVLPPDINQSWYDCTVVPYPIKRGETSEYLGAHWRRGQGPVDDPIRIPVALRIGLRYIRNLGDKEITRIEAARQIGGPFDSAEDLAQRTGLEVDALEALSAAGALEPLGVGRREGIWAAGALGALGPDRLALAEGAASPILEAMSAPEVMQAELWSTSISPTHPVSFLRTRLDEVGCTPVASALALKTHGRRMRVGGLITHRQRPSTARGVRFLNLEDETGLLNVVVLPQVWEVHYEVARKAIGVVIDGVLEYEDGVTNFLAHRFEEWPVDGIRSRDFR
jgi:error-prone DNA polymerase